MLPKPKNSRGYVKEEINEICKKRWITRALFNKSLGVNTCGVSKDGKTVYYYSCDVQRALYKIGCKDGVDHLWD